ncbi:hypothetical protein KIF59_08840 [Enterobacter cloacae subsp. cloacae]|nr:hypothetical protein [Enterobacter cloacae subsp. cloacae]
MEVASGYPQKVLNTLESANKMTAEREKEGKYNGKSTRLSVILFNKKKTEKRVAGDTFCQSVKRC